MHNHVTNKQLADYSAETMLSADRERFESHIHGCAVCRGKFEKIKIAIAPRFQAIELREELIERILDSWDKIKADAASGGQGGIKAILKKYPGTAFGTALAAAAAVIIVVSVHLFMPRETSGVYLTLGRADGGVTLNGVSAEAGEKVYTASSIKLSGEAIARIDYSKIININLINKCDFSVDTFKADKAGQLRLLNTLRDGIIVSSIHGKDTHVAYEYRTPNARVESMGTEFLLQTEGGVTLVIMKTDAVKATHMKSGKSMILSAGSRCIISDSFDVRPATDEDMKIFDDLDKLRRGAYARLLLPAIYVQKSDPRSETAEADDSSAKKGDMERREKKDSSENARNVDAGKQNERREQERENRQQRMEERKIQMNDMRRNNRSNMNQQMRRGR